MAREEFKDWAGRTSGGLDCHTENLRLCSRGSREPITIFEQETQALSIYGKEYGREDEWQLRKSKGKLSS